MELENQGIQTKKEEEEQNVQKNRKSKKIKKWLQQHKEVYNSILKVKTHLIINNFNLNIEKKFRTEYDICLCLDEFAESGLGQIPASQFSLFSKIEKIIQNKDDKLIEIELQNNDMNITPVEQITKMIQSQNQSATMKTCQILEKITQFHQQKQFQNIESLNHLIKEQQENYFLGFIIDLQKENNSQVSKFFINEKLLDLMGVTKEMYLDFTIQEKIIPDPICKKNYIHLWNDIMEKTLTNQNQVEIFIDTYEGYHLPFILNLDIRFIKSNQNQVSQIIQIWKFTSKNDINWLFKNERIEKNQLEFFNEQSQFNRERYEQLQQELGMLRKVNLMKRCQYVERQK